MALEGVGSGNSGRESLQEKGRQRRGGGTLGPPSIKGKVVAFLPCPLPLHVPMLSRLILPLGSEFPGGCVPSALQPLGPASQCQPPPLFAHLLMLPSLFPTLFLGNSLRLLSPGTGSRGRGQLGDPEKREPDPLGPRLFLCVSQALP